jgi:hypothetical protein
MIEGILYHILKGTPGWSTCTHTKIDVAGIISVTYDKRLFKIFDKHHDYTLSINYQESQEHATINPVIGGKGGITIGSETITEQLITKRYISLDDVLKEIDMIKHKQAQLQKYSIDIEIKLMNDMNIDIDKETLINIDDTYQKMTKMNKKTK